LGSAEIAFIRQTFGLDQRDLARAMNVAPYTVVRWESGWNEPTGLQAEVLGALHSAAIKTAAKRDDTAAKALGGLIALGIGALIFSLLTQEEPVTTAKPAHRSTRRRRR
jgi:transcriptional regulator with XRE-family HTH domain